MAANLTVFRQRYARLITDCTCCCMNSVAGEIDRCTARHYQASQWALRCFPGRWCHPRDGRSEGLGFGSENGKQFHRILSIHQTERRRPIRFSSEDLFSGVWPTAGSRVSGKSYSCCVLNLIWPWLYQVNNCYTQCFIRLS